MSTRAIRKALEAYRVSGAPLDERYAIIMNAFDEVEAIEKAARDLSTPQNPKEKAQALMKRIAKESKDK